MIHRYLLRHWGELHTYQIQIIFLTAILSALGSGFTLSYPYYVVDPIFICSEKGSDSQNINSFSCTIREACSGEYKISINQFDSIKSFTLEYNFICEERYKADFLGSIGFLGKTFGYIYYSLTVDTTKPLLKSILKVTLFQGIFGVIGGLSISSYMFYICFGAMFFFSSGMNSLNFAVMIEAASSSERFKSAAVPILYGASAFGCIVITLCSIIFSSSWRMISSVYVGLPLVFLWVRYRKIERLYEDFKLTQEERTNLNNAQPTEKSDIHILVKAQPWNLLKFRSLRLISVASLIGGVLLSFIYYCAHIGLDSLAGSLYMNMALLSGIEIIGSIIAVPISSKYTRKKSIYVLLAINFLVYLPFFWIYNEHPLEARWHIIFLNVLFALFGKMFNIILYNVFDLYKAEIFPQNYTALTYAVDGAACCAISIFIPQFDTFMKLEGLSPLATLSILNLVIMACVLPCPTKIVPRKIAIEEEIQISSDNQQQVSENNQVQ